MIIELYVLIQMGRDDSKRRQFVESYVSRSLDVLSLNKIYLFWQGVTEEGNRSEGSVWEGLKNETVWAGLDESYGGRDKLGCAVLMSERNMEECHCICMEECKNSMGK